MKKPAIIGASVAAAVVLVGGGVAIGTQLGGYEPAASAPTETVAPTVVETPAPEVVESPAPVEAVEPGPITVTPAPLPPAPEPPSGEEVYVSSAREVFAANGITLSDEEILAVGAYACEELAAYEAETTWWGEIPGQTGIVVVEGVDQSLNESIVSRAKQNLC